LFIRSLSQKSVGKKQCSGMTLTIYLQPIRMSQHRHPKPLMQQVTFILQQTDTYLTQVIQNQKRLVVNGSPSKEAIPEFSTMQSTKQITGKYLKLV
jgi:hypothetical protein